MGSGLDQCLPLDWLPENVLLTTSAGAHAVKAGEFMATALMMLNIFGDLDGVLIVPRDAVGEVLLQSMAKVREENVVREKLAGGETLENMFAEHGIL